MKNNGKWLMEAGKWENHLLTYLFILQFILGSISFAQFKLPEYQTITLDNGITVYLMEKKDVIQIT